MRNMFFASRRVVEGQYAGRHATSMRGHSVEFNDFRQYMPGDELADIDWKLYGRTDKLFIKLFEHQSDMTVNLLVDASASMAYSGIDGSGKRSKYDQACMLAAAIGFLTTSQQDKVAFALAQNGLSNFVRPHGSISHFCQVLREMESAKPAGKSGLSDALRKMAPLIGRRGLLIVLSDLLDEPEEVLNALSVWTHRGSEVILLHVLHADELRLPPVAEALFIDSETGKRLSTNVGDIRQAYEQRLSEFLGLWSSNCKGRGIDYKMVSTDMNYSDALEQYLFQRASMV